MSTLIIAVASRHKAMPISGDSKAVRIMISNFALVIPILMLSPLPALAADPYGANVGGKQVTSVERPVTKDLGLGLGRDELLQAARTSHPLRLAPSNFGPRNLDGSTTPGK